MVSISPWTIQGWRPFSVSTQPAVPMMNGITTAHDATRWKRCAESSLRRQSRNTPQSPMSAAMPAKYAMARIDQYCTNTLG